MITDHNNEKWSNRRLLERAAMQETIINKLKARISESDAKIAELTKCHLEAEKELLEREELVEKLQERLSAGQEGT